MLLPLTDVENEAKLRRSVCATAGCSSRYNPYQFVFLMQVIIVWRLSLTFAYKTVMIMNPAVTAELIEIPFGVESPCDPRDHMLHWGPDSPFQLG